MRLLVVEDEHYLAQMIKKGLEEDGFAVDVEYDGEDGFNAARTIEYDLIVLDVMMPEMNGIEMTEKLRAEGNRTPILMLTALDQSEQVISGLKSGADDYLAKPFSFGVLTARIEAILRRPHDKLEDILKLDDLELNVSKKQVIREGKTIKLSAKEFAILEYLLRNAGVTLSRETIMSHVWDFDADVLPNNLEVFINHLRKKVDRPFKQPLIHTIHGFGYMLSDQR